MNTTNALPDNSFISPMKQPLKTMIVGWIISDNETFNRPLIEYFSQWSNAKFKVLTLVEYRECIKINTHNICPDLVIIDACTDWVLISKQLKEQLNNSLPIILITNNADTDILRKALKVEIKDVLSIPFDESELDQIIYSCAQGKSANKSQGRISAFINAKGGMGATILSTSIAHILALEHHSIVLIDPDAQFGTTSGLLSTNPKFTLSDALNQVDTIDEFALNGMLTKHESGLKFIPNRTEHISDIIPEFTSSSFGVFLEQVSSNFSHVIIDLSRGLENSTLPALTNADDVYIVIQQNIPAIKEAAILIKKLKHLFGFTQQQIKIIVNRYSKNIDIKPDDIKSSLHIDNIILIPNDYLSVSAATNLGELLASHFEKKPIVKALKDVANTLTNKQIEEATGFKRFFSFLRS
ncbi:AAA family ATPase [Photobacterium makurazakiensis]|uniref:AAA family ATPase n=1 Tax=Photobacterium makurazakiensis TaxID=2910234 RepID=UPI003D0EA63B